MHCVDSDFLIDVARDDAKALRLLTSLEEEGPLRVSAITVFEVTDTARQRERARLLEMVGTLDVEPVDASVAIAASGLAVGLRKRGLEVPPGDLLIAATCVLRGLDLVTRNRRHFGRIPALRLRSW